MEQLYTTKCTYLGSSYGCRVFYKGRLVLEGRAAHRAMIGPTFRDLLRTLDKTGGGDEFTHAARQRKNQKCKDDPNRLETQVKHIWHM